MNITIEKLNELCKPLVDLLNEKGNPHTSIVITQEKIEVLTVELGFHNETKD